MIELKPCPFCGGVALFDQTTYGTDCGMVMMRFQIRCEKCNATAPQGSGILRLCLTSKGEIGMAVDERAKAAENWNRRTNDGNSNHDS